MFTIQYYLVDGQEINYQCAGDMPTMEDVSNVAMMYATMRPRNLPDTIFCSVRIYSRFMQSMGAYYSTTPVLADANQAMCMHTSVGILKVLPMPMASDAKLFLIGTREDFDRYDIDKIFDEVVIQGKESKDESIVHRGSAPKNQSLRSSN
jgi:hypothetical protein